MNVLSLSLAYLRQRLLSTLLNLLLLALGIATIAFLLLVDQRMEERLSRDVAGIDLVVGAKGSPLQLILSTVLQADIPTGNIPLSAMADLSKNPLVRQVIPVALGDTFQGSRIVGTTPDYVAHYHGSLAGGRMFAGPMEAVVGAAVARAGSLSVGDRIVGSHGLTAGGEAHADMPYTVVGILRRTDTVLDRLVLTPVESVWAIHEHHHHHHHEAGAADPDDDDDGHAPSAMGSGGPQPDGSHAHEAAGTNREVTAVLIRYASPLAAVRLPRQINAETGMQAASPAAELVRLLSLVGAGLDALRAFGMVLVVAAALGTFIALSNSLLERRYDLAVMRSLGASRGRIVCQIGMEALLVSLGGALLGLLIAHGGIALFGILSPQARDLGLSGLTLIAGEAWLLALALLVALAAAALPVVQAYRTDVTRILAHG